MTYHSIGEVEDKNMIRRLLVNNDQNGSAEPETRAVGSRSIKSFKRISQFLLVLIVNNFCEKSCKKVLQCQI